MRTPGEDAARLAGELQQLARRLDEVEGDVAFTKSDVDKIVENRLKREYHKRRKVEAERDELENEVESLRRELESLS